MIKLVSEGIDHTLAQALLLLASRLIGAFAPKGAYKSKQVACGPRLLHKVWMRRVVSGELVGELVGE